MPISIVRCVYLPKTDKTDWLHIGWLACGWFAVCLYGATVLHCKTSSASDTLLKYGFSSCSQHCRFNHSSIVWHTLTVYTVYTVCIGYGYIGRICLDKCRKCRNTSWCWSKWKFITAAIYLHLQPFPPVMWTHFMSTCIEMVIHVHCMHKSASKEFKLLLHSNQIHKYHNSFSFRSQCNQTCNFPPALCCCSSYSKRANGVLLLLLLGEDCRHSSSSWIVFFPSSEIVLTLRFLLVVSMSA